jgi:hypothetical protein
MNTRGRFVQRWVTLCWCVPMLLPVSTRAEAQDQCTAKDLPELFVDQGHAWSPPFGVDRVGSPLVAHVKLMAEHAPSREYEVVGFRTGRQVERHILTLPGNKSPYWGIVPLASIPDEVALLMHCPPDGHTEQLTRHSVSWPHFEADAAARPEHQINPVDLGAILVPHDWLLLEGGQTAVIIAAAISRNNPIPGASLAAWFDGGKPIKLAMPLAVNQRAQITVQLPLASNSDRSTLHVSLTDGDHELWNKAIHTMIVRHRPRWPVFGAVETKLRYDAPISVHDPKTGATLPSIDYNSAWDPKLNDIVVFLPNGSRFVFWRGASYAPFWAGLHNTGFNYQWVEGSTRSVEYDDAYEPQEDKELRFSRAQIIESTASRVHVRWSYQMLDRSYKRWGDAVDEDFYFYPDGFGTRVVTSSVVPGTYEYSEFVILTPQAAYPLDVLPAPVVDLLFLDGGKEKLTLPLPASQYEPSVFTKLPPAGSREERMDPSAVKMMADDYRKGGKEIPPVTDIDSSIGKLLLPRTTRVIYRAQTEKDDSAAAVYFSPNQSNSVLVMLPFYDHGQMVSPSYWGYMWPLSRGNPTTFGEINDAGLRSSPDQLSILNPPEPDPLFVSATRTLDALGQPAYMETTRRAWLIADTDAPDGVLLDWANSYSEPPTVTATGAQLDFPAYSAERRALRLIAESSSIEIALKPLKNTVNPIFEIAGASGALARVAIDGKTLPTDDYAWDGNTLWVRAAIAADGATIGLTFH